MESYKAPWLPNESGSDPKKSILQPSVLSELVVACQTGFRL